jgi:hypothetical protein
MTGSGWWPVLAACGLAYATKLAGHLLPERWLDHPVAARCAQLLPVALLAALVATSTVVGGADGRHIVIDARLAALAVAVVALLLRAPFIVVVVLAAVTAAGLRALGWG